MKSVVHVELPAKDGGRARKFYTSLLGWKFNDSGMPGMDYFMTDGVEPVVAVYSNPELKGPVIYFPVDDIDAAIRKVRQLGGTAAGKGAVPEQGWFVSCTDTEGNPFSLWQADKSAPALAPEAAESVRT
ncbi:MAG: VOC family protein [Candidatus Limnocylindria bacterium]